jgi:starch-binding outer membrane protein SusE/F
MKYFIQVALFVAIAGFIFTACEKVDALPKYKNGAAPSLSASVEQLAPMPADSLNAAVMFSWTNPGYSSDSTSYKYLVEIAPAGTQFAKAAVRKISGVLSTTYTAKEINDILLANGYSFGVAYDMDVRVTSSYANNNEQLLSNVKTLKMTPYKVPPKVSLPTTGKLYLVGSASEGGWNNPVPAPSQEFARLDETTWGGVFNLKGGSEFLILPLNGNWDNKFAVADNSVPGLENGGAFGFNFSKNFPGPASDGVYKIIVDFQSGNFTVTPYTENTLPADLFMVGNATPGDWNNPVPVPGQQFTRLNAAEWQLTLALNGGKEYLILPKNGSWDHKYAVADNSVAGLAQGGSFGYDKSQNFPGPATSGTYTIKVNFVTSKFTVTQ